jgi:hypothetical protein
MVRETSTWRIDSSHQYPPAWSASVSGSGRTENQRSVNTPISSGPRRSQIPCRTAGSSVAANPLESSVKAIPAWLAWRLAHSCPLIQILAG